MMKYITTRKNAIALSAALLLSGTIGCADQGDSPSVFAPLTNLLGLSSANSAFSNDLTNPAALPADVTVQQPPQTNAGDAPIRGIIAMESARLGRGSRVDADVSVLGTEHDRELVLHKYSRIEVNRTARADHIKLKKRAKILGTAEYNTIHLGKHASVADQVTPLGALPLLPPFLSGTPGTQKIGYQDSPLAAGNYGKLKLKKKKTLVLTGGIYHFTDVRLARKSSLICETTCVVLIKKRLRAGHRATVSAMSGKTNDLIIYVEGDAHYHHGCPHHHHSSVRLTRNSNTTADVYVLNGKLRIGRHASYEGNIVAKRVVVGRGAHVETGEEVPRRVAKLFRAGEAGVIEIPGEIRLEIPAGALSKDTLISIVPTAGLGRNIQNQPRLKLGTNGYDLKPDGLQFSTPATIAIHYDKNEIADGNGMESHVEVYLSNDDQLYFPTRARTLDTGRMIVSGKVDHFTFAAWGFFDLANAAVEVTRSVQEVAYVTHPDNRLSVIDVADLGTLPPPVTFPLPTQTWSAIEHKGYLYMTADEELLIYDVGGGSAGGNPLMPAFVSRISVPGLERADRMESDGVDKLFAASSVFSGNLLFSFDLSANRENPAVNSVSLPWRAGTVALDPTGNRVYVAVQFIFDNRVRVYSASDLGYLGEFTLPPFGSVHDIAISTNRIYVQNQTTGLHVADLTGPATIGPITTVPTGTAYSMTLFNGIVFSATESGTPFGRALLALDENTLNVLDHFPIPASSNTPVATHVSDTQAAYVAMANNIQTALQEDLFIVDISSLFSAPSWNQKGGSLNINPSVSASNPTLALNGSVPYVAWTEWNGTNQIYVKHWDGSAWVQDGGSLNVSPATTASADFPSLAFNGSTPYVAWSEWNGTAEQIQVKHWDGSAWVRVGTALNVNPLRNASRPSLAFNGSTPYVAWSEHNGTGPQVYVKYWDGSAWIQVGGSLNVNPAGTFLGADKPSLAFNGSVPYVAWIEWNGTANQVYVKHWDGSAWVQDGGSLNVNPAGALGADGPSLAFSGSAPYVAWDEWNGSAWEVYVKHWDGSAWIQVGGSLNVNPAGSWANRPSLAFSGSTPYVAWDESIGLVRQVYVKHWDGSAWVQDGGSLNVDPTLTATVPTLAFSGSTPYLSWLEFSGPSPINQIYVKALE